MKKGFIEFHERATTGKTKLISIVSKKTEHGLGEIKWFGRWRQYCFFPENSLWSKGCLEDVIAEINRLNMARGKMS